MRMFARVCVSVIILPLLTAPLEAGQSSASYHLDQFILGSVGNTQSGTGKIVHNNGGEALVGQSWSRNMSIQAGYFNDYFLPAPTPTVTCTPIRTFGDELLDFNYVYAAPNPIRGNQANIVYHLAKSAEVEIKIFTTTSKLVISKHWDSVPAGENHWYWNTTGIANGVYFLFINARGSDGKATTIKKKIAFIR
jgi:hypothetical protein